MGFKTVFEFFWHYSISFSIQHVLKQSKMYPWLAVYSLLAWQLAQVLLLYDTKYRLKLRTVELNLATQSSNLVCEPEFPIFL